MTEIRESLSIEEARKLVVLSQRVSINKQSASPITTTLSTIEHLGYIQIDTISVIQRAHHHSLWNRNPHYQPKHINELMADKKIYEYWSHAAAYLPMRDYRYSLPRKQAIAKGDENHWYERNKP
ncbi:DNA glycosylase AlkZ-like family protein, partial [Labilibaculum sp.]|uniref:DNA glycosylase AlkZ-like family protein n=1 Tax=Labilibaculum sp. TaxID=2060723 RepID=UPI0035631197